MMVLEVGMSQNLSNVMESSPVSIKENVSSVKLHEEKSDVCSSKCEEEKNPKENLMITCASNYEDNSFHMEVDRDQGMTMGPNEVVEVDVVGNGIVVEEMMLDRESLDATENSSSFGCTDSGIGTSGAASDVEVDSQLRDGDGSLKELDRLDLFKTRKKVTSHWRKYIQPVMWRCKWAELQIRKLDYLESKYDRELAECGRRKKCELENCAAEDLAIKSAPFVCQNRSRRVFKRNKRRRVEEMTDVAAYSSSHSLFSYFASKRTSGGSTYLDDNPSNTVTTSGEFDDIGEWIFLEFKDSNAFEKILRYIEVTQIRVRELKARIDEVITENAERFTSANSKLGLRGPLSSSGPSSILPKVNSENLVLPKRVVSGRGEVNSLPHMIGTAEQLRIGEKGLEIKSEVLLSNQSVKEESNTLERQSKSVNEVKMENVQHLAVPNSPSKSPAPGEQSGVKVRPKSMSTPKNKKQRMRRKARPGGRWVRKSCG